MATVTGFNITNWALGYGHETGVHFLKFYLVNSNEITISLSELHAREIGEALLNQVRQKPPKSDRLS
jgi:hypothetical protein